MKKRAFLVCLVFFAVLSGALVFSTDILASISHFLTINKAVEAKVLVVEGWIFDCALDDVVSEIQRGSYQVVLISGIEDKSTVDKDKPGIKGRKASNAEELRQKLIHMGIAESLLHAVPAPATDYHKTYSSAVAVKKWLVAHDIDAVNILSRGTHGRKTYVIFTRVFGDDIKAGIISFKVRYFQHQGWRRLLRESRITFKHLVGYIYALYWPFAIA